MTLPKPTRRPQLGITTLKSSTSSSNGKQNQANSSINNNNNKWWKPLVAMRWSSFLIFSLSVGILNLLNSHLVIHHDLNHGNDGDGHGGHSMHASIREILHRHYQQKLHHGRQQNSHQQHSTTTIKVEDDVTTHSTPNHDEPHLKRVVVHKKHKKATANDLHTLLVEEEQQESQGKDDSSSTKVAAVASLLKKQQRTSSQSMPTSHRIHHHRSIDFIPTTSLNLPLDAFSATWWQSRDRFLYQMQIENIGSVEGACFNAIREHEDEVKMTTDWLDFSVEHLSRWWKLLQYDIGDSTIAYHRIRDNLLQYILSAMQHEYQQRTMEIQRQLSNPGMPTTWPTVLLRKTIAVIAFMPYNSESQPVWGDTLTMVNLAATMASLARHGCGRIIVVTDENEVVTTTADGTAVRAAATAAGGANDGGDAPSKSFYLIHGAFQLLQEASRFAETSNKPMTPMSFNTTNPEIMTLEWFKAAHNIMGRVSSPKREDEDLLPPIVRKVAGTEVAFVAVDPNYDYYNDDTNTTETHYLVPKAALEGLKQAMLGQSDNPTRWLGDHAAHGTKRRLSYWRYVYLTEPDSILQTRPSALAQFAQRAISRRDAILIPHRLQPIPHESDVHGYKDNRYWVPELNEMSHVTLLDAAVVSSTPREEKEQDGDDDSESDEYEEDACCDGGIHRPKDDYDHCGNFWYVCGFQDEDMDDENYNKTNLERLPKYKRLFPYSLIRLQHGTGIVSLAATPHGRQCIPTKLKRNQKCPIPTTATSGSAAAATTTSSETRDKSNGGGGGSSHRRQGGKNSPKGNHQQDGGTNNSQESRAAAAFS